MGRVRRIFQLANGKLPSYNSAFVKMRGIAHPLDPFLSGALRFARKVGSPLPIWLPDNQTTLAADAEATRSVIKLSEPLSWAVIGSKISVDTRSFALIDDILDDGFTLRLTTSLITSYNAGTTVELHAHPLEVFGTYSPPSVVNPIPDEFVRSFIPKASVVAVSTSNIALAGEPTIDGVVTTAGNRVLLVGQADPTQNGIWEVRVFNWVRPSDFSGGSHAAKSHVFVQAGGLTLGASSWICTNALDSDVVADVYSAISGAPLTWAQLSVVTTFLVHSTLPIYKGDEINYKLYEYLVAESLPVGSLPDGRVTYQVTIDVGIQDTLENGRTDQVFLRAYPAYESTRRPLPLIPLTDATIGPFLFDRMSGSFFDDLDVPELDVVSVYNASGDRIAQYDAGKNFLLYHNAIPSDSFLFWDLSLGRLNFSRSKNTFVAFTNDDGKFHLHFKCVPEIVHVPGFQGWKVQVTPESDCYMIVQLEPNPVRPPFTTRAPGADPPPPPPRGGVFLPGGVTSVVNIDLPEGSAPVEIIHVLFDTPKPNKRIDMDSWEIRGVETCAFISHVTIAKVTGKNVWASSIAFAKPNWLRLAYLRVQTDLYSTLNAGLLST